MGAAFSVAIADPAAAGPSDYSVASCSPAVFRACTAGAAARFCGNWRAGLGCCDGGVAGETAGAGAAYHAPLCAPGSNCSAASACRHRPRSAFRWAERAPQQSGGAAPGVVAELLHKDLAASLCWCRKAIVVFAWN